MRYLPLAIALVFIATIAAVTAADRTEKATFDQVTALLETQRQAVNKSDIELYMATVHPDAVDESVDVLKELFKVYRLHQEVSEVKPVEFTDTLVTVSAVVETRKVAGPEFNDNKMWATFGFRKHNGKWLSSITDVEKIEFLDK
jgi:ketosteroid isomerase-like protein